MCGIVGFISNTNLEEHLTKALETIFKKTQKIISTIPF